MNGGTTDISSPGKSLFDLLRNLLPAVPHAAEESQVNVIDGWFKEDGRFSAIVRDSAVHYAFRRLLTSAVFLDRSQRLQDGGELIQLIRQFISDHTNLPRSDHERIAVLLVECIRARKAKVSSKLRRSLLSPLKSDGMRCYICGCELTAETGQRNTAIVEHIWPQKMGGGSTRGNLCVSCSDCSAKKSDYMAYPDYHYECICMVSDPDDRSFMSDFNSTYRIAVLAKSGFRCDLCGKPATETGGFEYTRENDGDSWHFLNIRPVCCVQR